MSKAALTSARSSVATSPRNNSSPASVVTGSLATPVPATPKIWANAMIRVMTVTTGARIRKLLRPAALPPRVITTRSTRRGLKVGLPLLPPSLPLFPPPTLELSKSSSYSSSSSSACCFPDMSSSGPTSLFLLGGIAGFKSSFRSVLQFPLLLLFRVLRRDRAVFSRCLCFSHLSARNIPAFCICS